MVAAGRFEVAFHGEYCEIVADERIVILASGVEAGMQEQMDALEQVVSSLS
jgi:hypothetical protein